MGRMLRHFWLPALLEKELPEPDCPPVRLRLLGEDLVAFRDTGGRVGILEAHCAHRRTSLFFGRNEENGLRCIYHGWKYDVEGNCVDIPAEPGGGESLKPLAKRVAYPTAVRGGVIWIYMGPPEFPSALPEFEWSTLPERQRTATKRLQKCNWVQAVDGSVDSAHAPFLHGRKELSAGGAPLASHWDASLRPVIETKKSPAGLLIGARRPANAGRYFWGISQFLLPFYQMFPPAFSEAADSSNCEYAGHAFVPIDDENTWTWSFSANPHRDYTDKELEFWGGADGIWGPIDEKYMPRMNSENDYGMDRQAQRDGRLFSGIETFLDQDMAVQESLGAIVDRTRELLGHSDTAIVHVRRLLLQLAESCSKGNAPEASKVGAWYNVRSASIVLDPEVPFERGAANLRIGGVTS